MANQSLGIGLLASAFGKQKKAKAESPADRNARIELYASRFAANQDLWTGQPRGANASDKPEVILADDE